MKENPIRIVIDKNLTLSHDLNLFNHKAKTLIFNNKKSSIDKSNYFVKVDCNNLPQNLLNELYKKGIQSVIIEGGYKTLHSFINSNFWDGARVFTAHTELINGINSPKINGKSKSEQYINTDYLKIIINDSHSL